MSLYFSGVISSWELLFFFYQQTPLSYETLLKKHDHIWNPVSSTEFPHVLYLSHEERLCCASHLQRWHHVCAVDRGWSSALAVWIDPREMTLRLGRWGIVLVPWRWFAFWAGSDCEWWISLPSSINQKKGFIFASSLCDTGVPPVSPGNKKKSLQSLINIAVGEAWEKENRYNILNTSSYWKDRIGRLSMSTKTTHTAWTFW